jgi:hypothetical protein
MDSLLEESSFETLHCKSCSQSQPRPSFAPRAHDLIVLGRDGRLRMAKNLSAERMADTLRRLNRKFMEFHDSDDADKTGALTLM